MLTSDQIANWKSDLDLVTIYIADRGLPPSNRLVQLSAFLDDCLKLAPEVAASRKYGPEYLIYAHEYLGFFAEMIRLGFQIDLNSLRRIFSGSLSFADEATKGDDSRNLLLQIKAASYLANAGLKTTITESTDVVALGAHQGYVVECKRIYSVSKCRTRVREAAKQLEAAAASNLICKPGRQERRPAGIVWLDLSPAFLEPFALVPVVDVEQARSYNLQMLKKIVAPVAQGLSASEFPAAKFVVAQGSAHFSIMATRELQYRTATYVAPTRHCGWLEGQKFRKATSYLQGYERGPHMQRR